MLGTEDRTIGAPGNAAIRDNHAKHTGPSYLLELKNGGHYSFTVMFKINKSFGDGVGAGKRRDTNEPFEFTLMEATYKIINSYSVSFLGYYLKGQKEYGNFFERESLAGCDEVGRDRHRPSRSSRKMTVTHAVGNSVQLLGQVYEAPG